MKAKPVLLDGAMGTQLLELGFKPPFEDLALTHPQVIKNLHNDYINASSEVLLTHTFNAQTSEQCQASWEITKDLPVRKFASIGPHANVELLVEFFKDKCERLVFETIYHLDMAALVIEEYSHLDPIFSFCLRPHDFKLALEMLAKKKLSTVGLNCLDGFEDARILLSMIPSHYEIYFKPNTGTDKKNPKDFAYGLMELNRDYTLSYIGGCCGTTPAHIKELRTTLKDR